MIQDTSLLAYRDLIRDNKLQPEELKVYRSLREYGNMTDIEISLKTGLDKNAVNGRRNSLVKKGLVVERGRKVNPFSGKLNILWGTWDSLL